MDHASDTQTTRRRKDKTAFLDAIHSPVAPVEEVVAMTPDEWREAMLSTVPAPGSTPLAPVRSGAAGVGRPACIEPF